MEEGKKNSNYLLKVNCNKNDNEIDINQKKEISPYNNDYENVDNESINIDDIFDENPSHDDWTEVKDFSAAQVSFSGDMNNISCMNSDAVTFIQPNQYQTQFDNKYFFITDIINKEKCWYNQERFVENKPAFSVVLNNNVQNSSFVNNSFNIIKQENNGRTHIKSSEQEMSYAFNGNLNICSNFTKNKAIRPLMDNSPNKKHITAKQLKSNEQLCYVCNDSATGKHYGIVSCEGCKGFFKRTIRNSLSYKCRDFNNCSVDKKLRNRCQACRFQKCLIVGMKREAVQMEKSERRNKMSRSVSSDLTYPSPSSSILPGESFEKMYTTTFNQINWEHMLHIEISNNPEVEEAEMVDGDVMKIISEVVNDHLFSIVYWAKYMPGFDVLSISDQTLLINMSWGELVIANFTHRSLKLNADIILLRNGSKLIRETAVRSGIGILIDRVIFEILHRFRDMKIDRCELSYIKAIILFNPNLKNLENRVLIQMIRDKYYSSLQKYCTDNYLSEKFRFNKLLLRLPSLRSVALIFLDHFKLYDILTKSKTENIDKVQDGESPYNFLDEMLQNSNIIFDH